ncbi:MAG TPA: hypothetical protein VNT75_21235 [Symbiobacteriaceae bacterium]|nr:hypothetical protein [Symbiobacteriaceae bacterium]
MNDVELKLRKDRVAGLPEMPDLRYTESAVRRRLGRGPEPAPAGERFPWAAAAVALGMTALLAVVLWWLGVSLWWLAAFPVTLLPMVPILLTKEREGA